VRESWVALLIWRVHGGDSLEQLEALLQGRRARRAGCGACRLFRRQTATQPFRPRFMHRCTLAAAPEASSGFRVLGLGFPGKSVGTLLHR